MKFEVLKNTYFKAYIIHWHYPMGFAVGEAKEVLLYKKIGSHGNDISLY